MSNHAELAVHNVHGHAFVVDRARLLRANVGVFARRKVRHTLCTFGANRQAD